MVAMVTGQEARPAPLHLSDRDRRDGWVGAGGMEERCISENKKKYVYVGLLRSTEGGSLDSSHGREMA